MKALIVKPKWANLILDGLKTIELRGTNTSIRGTIGIIKSGSKKVYGTVDLVGCIKLDEASYSKMLDKHKVSAKFDEIPCKNLYGWILENPVIYKEPMPYNHKQGYVIWVNI